MVSLNILKEEKIGDTKAVFKLLTSLSDEEVEKIFQILETKPVSQALRDKSIANSIASEISKTLKRNQKQSIDILESIVNLALISTKTEIRMLHEDMKTIGVNSSEIEIVKKIITICKKKGLGTQLQKEREIRQLSEAILPYLSGSAIELDVRYSFTGNKIKAKVPIALIRLDLTAYGEKECKYSRFQTTADVLKLFIQDLRKTYKKLNLLEKS